MFARWSVFPLRAKWSQEPDMFQIIDQHDLYGSQKTIVLTTLAAIFVPMSFVAVRFRIHLFRHLVLLICFIVYLWDEHQRD